MNPNKTCKTCEHYQDYECHKKAPSPVTLDQDAPGGYYYVAIFPHIASEKSCGEWENGNAFEEVNDGTKKS
jgi:hypothetical protein